jgi:hypothetical protein
MKLMIDILKKNLLAYIILLSSLLLTSCIKQNTIRITMDVLLKTTSENRKDIGIAD